MMIDKPKKNKASKIQKLAFWCFLLTSAKMKKFQDGDRSIIMDRVLYYCDGPKPDITTSFVSQYYFVKPETSHT